MAVLDLIIILIYFVAMAVVGVWFSRRASSGLENYFLGGRRMPWWALSMSGSVSNFDITGTMWIVSLIVLLGMKSMWVHWMWGFLLGAFFLAYMGKWVRRSEVMTAAEWMKTRFGDEAAGRAARYAYAMLAVLITAFAVGYAYQGIGKFAAVFIPLESWIDPATSLGSWAIANEAHIFALTVIGLTTLYVLAGGLLSVVVTDVIQTVVLTFAAIFIGIIAWQHATPDVIAKLPEGFTSLAPVWRLDANHAASAEYGFFGAFVIVWVAKGLLLNLGGPGQMYDFQRFLAAADPREAAKVGAAWSMFLVVRWGMAMGIALIAIGALAQQAADPEQAMPLVLQHYLPAGIRGLVIAGLLAAFMSTFSSTVNSGAAFVVCDVWSPIRRDQASSKELMLVSYASTLGLVAVGLFIGSRGESINQIWQWMMMVLTGSIVVPNILRWYWARLNGWGYTFGAITGLLPVLLVKIAEWGLMPDGFASACTAALGPVYIMFPLILLCSLIGCVVGSYATAPTDAGVLEAFYFKVRPFGLWGGVARRLPADQLGRPAGDRLGVVALNVVLGCITILALYLAPMYLVGHWYGPAAVCAAAALAAGAVLYFTWYRTLPPSEPKPLSANVHAEPTDAKPK